MKYAVISVSETGAALGQKILAAFPGGTAYERRGAESGGDAISFDKTLTLTDEIFTAYDGLLYIMATGIAVRAIAPHVVSKTTDPAVLVMDEGGHHCISLLSGHLGGANVWAREIAAVVGAEPVITTATDVHGKKAPDDIARKFHMRIEPVEALKPVNAAIASGKDFAYFVDMDCEGAEDIIKKFSETGISALPFSEEEAKNFAACAVVTEWDISLENPHVFLRPKNIFVGIGCRRGTPEALVSDAFHKAITVAGVSKWQIKALASVDIKKDEEGLLDFSRHIGIPIHFHKAEELLKVAEARHLAVSEFVLKKIGVGNVCETAAIAEASMGRTLLAKTKFSSVTAAIAVGSSASSESDPGMRRK